MKAALRPIEDTLNHLISQARQDPIRSEFKAAKTTGTFSSSITVNSNSHLISHLETRAIQETRGLCDPLMRIREEAWTPSPDLSNRSRLLVNFMETWPANVDSGSVLAWPWAQLSPLQNKRDSNLLVVFPILNDISASATNPHESFARELATLYDMCRFGRFYVIKSCPYKISSTFSPDDCANSISQALLLQEEEEDDFTTLIVWPLQFNWLSTSRMALTLLPMRKHLLIGEDLVFNRKHRMARLIGLCVGMYSNFTGYGPVQLPLLNEDEKKYATIGFSCVLQSADFTWFVASYCNHNGSLLKTKCSLVFSDIVTWLQSFSHSLLYLVSNLDPTLIRFPCLLASPKDPTIFSTSSGNTVATELLPSHATITKMLDDLSFLATASEYPAKCSSCVNFGAYAPRSLHYGWHQPLFIRAAYLLSNFVNGCRIAIVEAKGVGISNFGDNHDMIE